MRYVIKSKETYTSKGEEKTMWHDVGLLVIEDNIPKFIKLNQNPHILYSVFLIEDKPTEPKEFKNNN